MALASNYLIATNDEHGQNPATLGKRTPVLPYVNRSFYENEFNRVCKNFFIIGLLRCGFNAFDVKPEINDVSVATRVSRINNARPDLLVNFGYNAFGNGLTFNSVKGATVFYSENNRYDEISRILAEDIAVEISSDPYVTLRGVQNLSNVGVLQNVNCPSCLVEPGFMTNFLEAKLMLDVDFVKNIAESTVKAVCNNLNVTYLPNVITNYNAVKLGSSGKPVLLLQYLLNYYDYNLKLDGIFGTNTQNAVLEFQQDNNLVQDGIVGKNTYTALLNYDYDNKVLRRSSRVSAVRYAQYKLLSKLYPLGEIDGVYGPITESAVRTFQQENDLVVDGIIGKNTWAKLSLINQGRPLPN